jgi:hypothetical protein
MPDPAPEGSAISLNQLMKGTTIRNVDNVGDPISARIKLLMRLCNYGGQSAMSETQSEPTQDAQSDAAPDAQVEAQPEVATPEITVQPPTPPTKKPDPWEI